MQPSGWIPQHIIACASGAPGTGKTMALTAVGYQEYLLGKKIFSTYKLNFPHEFVESKEQLYKMRNGVFLGDELWRWLFSRKAMYKEQQEILMDFIENIRKRGIDMVYAGHYDDSIDRVVREVTRYYVDTSIVPMQRPDMEAIKHHVGKNGESEEVFKAIKMALTMPENYGVRVDIYKEIMPHEYEHINSLFFKNLRVWGSLFFTKEEVGELKEKEKKQKRKGVTMEEKLYDVLCNHGLKDITYLIPSSGHGSPYPGDIICGKNLIDVKGVIERTAGNDRIDVRNRNWNDYFLCTKKFDMKTWLAFYDDKWYFVSINYKQSFINNNTWISIVVLKQNAISLKSFCTEVLKDSKVALV